MIPFNKPHLTGNELSYIQDAVHLGHLSGNGKYTQLCQRFFEETWGFPKCLLTTSCTDALEMCALLLDIKPGDEVIVPSYTFVSTALAFVRQGAVIRFVDSHSDRPGMDESQIESLITPRTKAIVVVHYAGVACDMDLVMDLALKNNLFVVEDAAHSFDSYYKGKALGSIGHLATFSFHETKNIHCGEGGMLVINDVRFQKRAEIIWEKGTNRAQFARKEVQKYEWVDTGSSFLMSDMLAAFLYAQLLNWRDIQQRRLQIWNWYDENVETLFPDFQFEKPILPAYATNNAHIYYLLLDSKLDRDTFISTLREKEYCPVFHYLALHKSPFYAAEHDGRVLPNSVKFEERLVRLPFYYDIPIGEFKIGR